MYIRYDSLNRHEPLTLVLCNPGSTYSDVNRAPTNVVGILDNVTDEELCLNFNQLSELNFRVSRIHRDDSDEDAHAFNLYKSVQNRRLIYITGIGYFMIVEVSETRNDDRTRYKDVRAESIEVELQNHKIPFIEDGTYRFSNRRDTNKTKDGLMERLVKLLPLWRLGEVDDAVAEKSRTFTEVDTDLNILAFLINNMQEAYECIFIFDAVHRLINVYDQNNYVHTTNIHITKDDVIHSIDVTENSDSLYTAISVLGGENISIAALNPLGGNVIYDFTHYLSWMSESLGERVIEWGQLVAQYESSYYDLNCEYYTLLEDAFNLQAEIQRLEILLTMYHRCRDNIVAEGSTDVVGAYNEAIRENGGTPIDIGDSVEEVLAAIDELIAQCESQVDSANEQLHPIEDQLETLKVEIDTIHGNVAILNYFTDEEYAELSNYIFEGSYTDDYIVITDMMTYSERFEQMKILFDRAKSTLNKVSRPTQEFNIDVENFLFAKKFEHWSQQLETGCLINVELEDEYTSNANRGDCIAALFLSNITVNYDDQTLSMTFGNRYNKFDPKSLFDNMLGNISKSANTLGYLQDALYPVTHGELNDMKEALATSRTLTMDAALSSDGEEVIVDGSGYTGRRKLPDGSYDPRQIKLTGRAIVLTDDAWETCKVAIGEILLGDNQSVYGINAETIIGDMIVGNQLRILDNNGNDAFIVLNDRIQSQITDIYNAISQVEQTADAFNIRITTLEANDGKTTEVTTTTGFTFNADGLTIYKSGEEIKNLLDNTGMYVTRVSGDTEEIVLAANNTGVTALNLTARQYLVVGKNSRFEDYANSEDSNRTACFYIGTEGV